MKNKTASQLIWDYQHLEDSIEVAEQLIKDAAVKKAELFDEIAHRPELLEALLTVGVTTGKKLYKIGSTNSAVIDITLAPVSDYSLTAIEGSGDV